jgi:acyl-coenzyme A synthetase/AMP-(fatty) acid ligase
VAVRCRGIHGDDDRYVQNGSPLLADELRDHVGEKLGKFCRPKYLTFTQELPKTRSGKIMRRLQRDIAEGRMLGGHDDTRRF